MTITDERPASEAARRAMIDSQLRTSGINEPWVLEAMNSVAREDFVPENARAAAYIDRAVPLGNGHFLPAPLVHGWMLTEARPNKDDKALLIGTSGYLAALVSPFVGSLDARDMGEAGSGAKYKKNAYSLILIEGAVEQLPDALVAALADGGRIVAGLVERGVTRIASGRKAGGTIAWLPLAEIGVPVLPEFAAPRRWSF